MKAQPASPHPLAERGHALMRIRGLVRKEFLQILRDPSSIAIAFLMPVLLLFLFGYGVSLDAKDVPVAIVVEEHGPAADDLVAAFRGSPYFRPTVVSTIAEADSMMKQRTIKGIICLKQNFSRQISTHSQPAIQVIVNGVDANYGRLVLGYAQGVWDNWQRQTVRAQGKPLYTPVQVESRIWFNEEVRSRSFLVPGLIAVIMTLIGALLTAMVMAREWERGTMEALLVTPVRIREIIFSKVVSYFLLGTGSMLLSVTMALFLFHVPLRGSFGILFLASSLFLLAALGMGLLISTVTRNQFVAGQVAIIATFLPAFLLSGFIFNIVSMPWLARGITYVIAARYFVAILQTVFLAGDLHSILLPNMLALLIMIVVFFTLVRRKSRKRLD